MRIGESSARVGRILASPSGNKLVGFGAPGASSPSRLKVVADMELPICPLLASILHCPPIGHRLHG